MNKVLIRTYSGIVIFTFAFAFVVLGINTSFHSNLAKGEKPAVCDSGDKSINTTESKICSVPTTENATNATTRSTKSCVQM
jgi:hypothetical protein